MAWRCCATLPALEKLQLGGDRQYGVNIIRRALEEPLRQMTENAGVEGAVVVDKVKGGKGGYGYNVATGEYEDLVRAGVIDPTKVVRVALQNAASVASLMLATEAVIAERPKRDGPGSRHGWHGHVTMLALRRAGERHHVRHRNRDAWSTFEPPVEPATFKGGFDALERLEENRVPPGRRRPEHAAPRCRDRDLRA